MTPLDPGSSRARDVSTFLRDALAALLGVEPGAVRDDVPLQEQGLDSARTLALLATISRELGRAVPASALWQYTTLGRLARYLAGAGGEAPSRAARAARAPAARPEPVAIVGIGCRLPPDVATPRGLWEALAGGADGVREVPPERWVARDWYDPDPQAAGKTTVRRGGFLDDVAGFDAAFFRISPAEAAQMDPQQRVALEVSFEALEDAGVVPAGLAGSRTGVFLGAMWQEYGLVAGADAAAITMHSATGWDNSIIPARVAYALGLRGPAMAVATACSSSLVAVQLAAQSLRRGESDLALAGGVSLMLHPHTTVAMTKLGAMSPDGRCRAFDAGANGYVRGEGCVVLTLRRLSDALAAGDRVYAVLRGGAVNNDGASNGLTAPNPEAQVEVVRAAWGEADVPPGEVAYVECHGTGT
ncbi:MAG TPA: type I polyketide synthase, partial [Polyangiaceae bacterium]|nr:type I polyketide synthase [Polyangiaceae bacterium]